MSRNIFGWSYPPGVTESMLPGNSKEEQEAEAMVDLLYSAVAPLRKFYNNHEGAEQEEDVVVTALERIVSEAYAKGRDDAKGDEAEAQEHLRERSEQRRRESGYQPVCVGCGETEAKCECEVHDFENK